MKKILKRFLLLTFVFSIVNGTFPVYASDNEDVKNFEEAIKGDAFKFETNVESHNNDNLEIIGRYTEDLDVQWYAEWKKHVIVMYVVNQIKRLWYNFRFMGYLDMTEPGAHVRIQN